MPDIALIATVLSSLNAATDIAKGIREADLSLAKAELKGRLADLVLALADARIALASVQEEVAAKEREIRELKETLGLRTSMTYTAPFYWHVQDDKREGPFCQQCYDAQQKVVRLHPYDANTWMCKTCHNSYYVSPPDRSRPRRAETDWDPFSR